MHKEKEPFRQKEESRSLSTVINGVTTHKPFLLVVEGTMRPSLDDVLANLQLVAAAFFFTNDPRLKTPDNELVRITIKTPYNGLNDYNWKHRI